MCAVVVCLHGTKPKVMLRWPVRSVEPICSIRDGRAYADSYGRIAGAGRLSAQRGAGRGCLR